MNVDCAIVGGGPAGLNAALVLGRARKQVALFDNSQPRNAVTHASHGFITRDGVKPEEFRRIAYDEVLGYPSVRHWQTEVTEIQRTDSGFILDTSSGERVLARKLILSGGLKEELPEIKGLRDLYGKSLFNCPFCDGWELRDQPLMIISDNASAAVHKAKLLYNWSRDLVLFTNGHDILSAEQEEMLMSRGIRIVKTPIASLSGNSGMLQGVHFEDGTYMERSGGFIDPKLVPHRRFDQVLGYETAENGGIVTDAMGRTTAAGIYAAGDSSYVMPSQLIYAAASGSKAAMGVVADLLEEDWQRPLV
ncbi:NAD(P)/FAD-dependent oxidoreductase [Paenibacillus sp. JX-17]|uniref:NAD(P)/FAD-dependent oxidoreductase n=1 Tax=Paenibacillus lacisoli TaxID=3064525 RepID=A0ABT9CA54_9BACL|nr:NAD(P)/FAD-dependent oxidoreductase [Paenibacillus sp. JX-17]MDO7906138.1 NAD(P)/FAD-dependent oxidoreductase [Paenibacillus sp. JX-17]